MPPAEKRIRLAMLLKDQNKWQGVFFGLFHYSIIEREMHWTYEDDVEFFIACAIRELAK